MFEWRLKLREAEEAFKGGRLEEAGRLLNDRGVREFLPARRLLDAVASKLVERGQARAARGETTAGWRDLQAASQWGAIWKDVAAARSGLVEQGLGEVHQYLAAGDTDAARARLEELMRRDSATAQTRKLSQAIGHAATAGRLAREGKLTEACELLSAAAALCPEVPALGRRRDELAALAAECRAHELALHAALSAADWPATLAAADALLAACPQHAMAADARRRAWEAVGTKLSEPARPRLWTWGKREPKATRTMPASDRVDEPRQTGPRFLMWIDAVGGFLVCHGDRIVIGQPEAEGGVDLPILGDVSRRHAVIERQGEGYVIHPTRTVKIDGQPINGTTPLADGMVLTLGESVRLRFRKPHPLSNTARLEFVSHHRTQPSVDAVILMSDSCVLGPGPASHVVCPRWSDEVVLFGRPDDLTCRCRAGLEIDGVWHQEQGAIGRGSRISGEAFSLSLEAL